MKLVFKYPVAIGPGMLNVEMPAGAAILCLQMQMGNSCFWALIDDDTKMETRRFAWFGTGIAVDEGARYVGTVQRDGGMLVWHLFEVTK